MVNDVRKKVLFITHEDLDGVISAALEQMRLNKEEGIPFSDMVIYFRQPTELDDLDIPIWVDEVYVTDIGISRNQQETINFIKRAGGKLKRWTDHHEGWAKILALIRNRGRFIINERAKACAEIIGANGNPDSEILVQDAIYADTRIIGKEFSPIGLFIEEAIKSDMKDSWIKDSAVKYARGDKSQESFLQKAVDRYQLIKVRTDEVAAGYKVDGNIAEVTIKTTNGIDLTRLLLKGQNMLPEGFAVVIRGPSLTIATYLETANLVRMFGLSGGFGRRISLPISRKKEVIEKLRNFKPQLIVA